MQEAEVKAIATEARVCVDAAILAAESLERHKIIPSTDFERLVRFLHEAAELLHKVE